MGERLKMLERLSAKNKIKYPLAVVGSALAGIAITGCGGGDETIQFGVLCEGNKGLRVLSAKQYTGYGSLHEGSVTIACEDDKGDTNGVKSIQLADLSGGNAASANNTLSVKVNEDYNQEAEASFDVGPNPDQANSTTINFNNIDEIKEVKVTPEPPK